MRSASDDVLYTTEDDVLYTTDDDVLYTTDSEGAGRVLALSMYLQTAA